MALNAAALDTRIKVTVASTMYDMSRVNANGYFDAEASAEARYEKRRAMNAQRIVDYKNGSYELGGGVVDPLPEDAFAKLKGDNKELLIIPDAVHTDLYDGGGKDAIPFDKLVEFFHENLK